MSGILNFIQQVLSTPAIFVGLIALLGFSFVYFFSARITSAFPSGRMPAMT